MAGYIGNFPTPVPLTSADLADSIITSAKIADGTIVNADINASAGVVFTKLASTGTLTVDNIQFPATAVSSANANNLDDYEEGTWTPAYGGSSTNPTASYNIRNGTYTKIGKVVCLTGHIRTSGLSGGSGNVQITGLPFAASSGASYVATGSIYQFNTAGEFGNVLRLDENASVIDIYYGAYNVQPTSLVIADLDTGSFKNEAGFAIVYQT